MKYSETKASQLTGLSRATIQRYRDSVGKENRKVIDPMYEQKDGLKYCYFNEIEMEKLWMIKIFQSLGKTREEIVGIMTDTKINMLKHLSIAIEELDKLLTIAKQYVNTGISHRVIKEVLYENKDVSYEQLDDILKLISSEMCEEEKILERKIINNDRIERLFNTIIECYDNHIPFTDSKIQNSIRHIMRELCPCKYYSLEMLSGFLIAILGQIHIDDNNAKICRYLYDAIEYYKNNTKELNQEYCVDNVFNNVANYYVNGHKSDSKIVFDEILKYAIYLNSLYNNKEYVIYKLDMIGKHICSENIIKESEVENANVYYNYIYEAIKSFNLKVVKDSIDLEEQSCDSEYDGLICPYCDAPLTFNLILEKWECDVCNHFYEEESLLEADVHWFCDKCGSYLNDQKTYVEDKDMHKCEECGYVNNLSKKNILD